MRTIICDWSIEDKAPYYMGRQAILLSSKGQGDEAPELAAFLKYVGGEKPQDTREWRFTHKVDELVSYFSEDPETRRRAMLFSAMIQEERLEAYEDGKAEGVAIGIEQGNLQATARNVASLMAALQISETEALDALNVPDTERPRIRGLLTKHLEQNNKESE